MVTEPDRFADALRRGRGRAARGVAPPARWLSTRGAAWVSGLANCYAARLGARRRTGGGLMRVAMIGQKGIPATYGGIERHVDEIARRLVPLGIDVDVFCRFYYTPAGATYHGVRLLRRPSIHTKHLDADHARLVGDAGVHAAPLRHRALPRARARRSSRGCRA